MSDPSAFSGVTQPSGRKTTRVGLVLPCHNEERAIASLVESISQSVGQFSDVTLEVCFVDDGSTDNTWSRITSMEKPTSFITVCGIRFRTNQGKARAQAAGIRELAQRSDLVIVMDADGQHDPRLLRTIIERSWDSQLPQIGTRTRVMRSKSSQFGVGAVDWFGKLAGTHFDSSLTEYVALPNWTARDLAENPQLGVLPLLPLLLSTSNQYQLFECEVLNRIDGTNESRWTLTQLWQKGILQLLSNPSKTLPRLALGVAIVLTVLAAYGLAIGIGSIARGDLSGTSSVILALVVLASAFIALQLVTLGVLVVLLRTIVESSLMRGHMHETWTSDHAQ